MNERDKAIWRGQALNIAKDELLSIHKGVELMDLDMLFKRAKQIFNKASDHNFFEWQLSKEVKEKHDWVVCKKCGERADRAHYEYCKCGEKIPPKE